MRSVLLTRLIPAAAEELSEEDQQLKNELEMLVERLTVGRKHPRRGASFFLSGTDDDAVVDAC